MIVYLSFWYWLEVVELIFYFLNWDEIGGLIVVVFRDGVDDLVYWWLIVDFFGIGDLCYINDCVFVEEYFVYECL